MEYVDWFWQLVPDSRPGLQGVTIAILVSFFLVLALAIATSIATVARGEAPWRWGGPRPHGRPR